MHDSLVETSLLIGVLSQYLQEGSIDERHISKLTPLLDRLIDLLTPQTFPIEPVRLIRATRNRNIGGVGNKRIDRIEHLKYPPKKEMITKYGRCNIPEMQILYGAFYGITATKELRPEVGDLVTFSEWRLIDDEFLIAFPVFYNDKSEDDIYNGVSTEIKMKYEIATRKLPPMIKFVNDKVCKFLADCFSKRVDLGNHFDYFLSAYISNKIMSLPFIDCILYPSVQEKLGLSNLAVSPFSFDSKFQLFEVRSSVFTSITPGGGLMFENLDWSRSFDLENHVINWK